MLDDDVFHHVDAWSWQAGRIIHAATVHSYVQPAAANG